MSCSDNRCCFTRWNSTQKHTNVHILKHNHHKNAGIRSHAEAPWENTLPPCLYLFVSFGLLSFVKPRVFGLKVAIGHGKRYPIDSENTKAGKAKGNKNKFKEDRGLGRVMSRNSHKYNRYRAIIKHEFTPKNSNWVTVIKNYSDREFSGILRAEIITLQNQKIDKFKSMCNFL